MKWEKENLNRIVVEEAGEPIKVEVAALKLERKEEGEILRSD